VPIPDPRSRLVVGFDLDMTLVDSALSITRTLQVALAEAGVEVEQDQIWPWVGVPLDVVLNALAPGVDVATTVARYRALYPIIGVPTITPLPGAAEALAAVESAGGTVVVVSAKVPGAVREVLEHVGMSRVEVGEASSDDDRGARLVVGGLFAAAKGTALREHDASVYVGDHPGDVEAARAGGAVSVAVATGPFDAGALAEAGADVVLPDLTGFPGWLQAHLAEGAGAASSSFVPR
jgi:phosphoglycolate phosphatase-like HAD superfamily hydrolase